MPDKILKCVQCGAEFVFTAGEQSVFEQRELSEPKRCQECRAKRKANIDLDAKSPRSRPAQRGSR
jgi:DNA-directed RNA polymerase subunit RPC12/RpoP